VCLIVNDKAKTKVILNLFQMFLTFVRELLLDAQNDNPKVPLRLWLPMRLVIGFTKPRNPILGMVLAGEVESVGTEVTRFQKGNQVYAFNIRCGTYAEYTCLPENSVMALKPSPVTYEEAAAVPY